MGEFFEERLLALLDALIAIGLTALATILVSKLKNDTFIVKLSLRWKINGYIFISLILGLLILYFTHYNVIWASISVFAFLIIICNRMLSNFSTVGILNVFPTTAQGIMPARSLKMITSRVDFLGIGGAKLTDKKDEFVSMLKKVKENSGEVRFLLSLPGNETLASLANEYERDERLYQFKVAGSAREIKTQCEKVGVKYELRFYDLDNEFSLPAFRLMFVDDRVCIFSFLHWNKSEGLDNPQMIVRKKGRRSQSALYKSMQQYFESLWGSKSVIQITDPRVKSLLADD